MLFKGGDSETGVSESGEDLTEPMAEIDDAG
jgi:hypothetical protein